MIGVQKVLLLRKVDLFSEMTVEQLGRVATVTSEVVHPAGATVITQGEAGDALYVVAGGELEVTKDGERVSLLHEADSFGELAVLTGETRRATVRALTDCLLLRLERKEFQQVLAANFDAVLAVIRTICRRFEGGPGDAP